MIKISQNLDLNKKSVAIKVSNLNKRFGTLVAVNNVSFEIGQGEMLEFLVLMVPVKPQQFDY